MNIRTQLIIGAVVVALGVGVVMLGFVDQDSNVRQVHELLSSPDDHAKGTYTLVGIPQPEILTTFASGGDTVERVNAAFQNTTTRTIAWNQGDTRYFSTLSLTVAGPDENGTSHWSLQNRTTLPGSLDEALPTTWSNWTLTGPHKLFLIQGFVDENGDTPIVFGVYQGVLREPLQPKPSQFEGRLATALPDGTPLPSGAMLFWVDEYTAGCSSKFIPEEQRDEYADS